MKKDDLNDRLFNFAVLGGEIKLKDNTSNCLNIFIKSKRNIKNTIPPPEVLKFLPNLLRTPEFSVIRYQLAKSSTSSGANYEEAQAGSSKADFNNKVRISLREMRESNYWLRVLKATFVITKSANELEYLIDESEQLKKILGSIVTKTNK